MDNLLTFDNSHKVQVDSYGVRILNSNTMGFSKNKLTTRGIAMVLLTTVTLLSSCSLNPKRYFSKQVNLGGVLTHEPSSYTPVETGTFRVSSDELVNRRHHKGGKTSLLWGLFTYTDY
jgi:hypothetical protein